MRVGVIGINHKLANLKLREQLAKTCQRRFGTVPFAPNDHHFILLSTCNRTEVYFSSEDLANTHSYLLNILRYDVEEEFDHKLYSYFGKDCFSHLIRVTAGLDSAILAETEIQGQVKMAYEISTEHRLLPKELHFLFQKALNIAKKIRFELQLGRGMPSLEYAILQTGKHFFKKLEEARILFIGASEINQKILTYLKTKHLPHITLCNRSNDSAYQIALTQNIQVLEWSHLSEWHHYDWIILGTKSPDYLIKKEDIYQKVFNQKLMMDLCVPRNVEPRLGQDPRITLLNIDQINQMLIIRNQYMKDTLSQAEEKVLSYTHEQMVRYHQKEQSKMTLLAITA